MLFLICYKKNNCFKSHLLTLVCCLLYTTKLLDVKIISHFAHYLNKACFEWFTPNLKMVSLGLIYTFYNFQILHNQFHDLLRDMG